MFEIFKNEAIAEFDLVADGPLLISSGIKNNIDPTLPNTTFLSGYIKNGERTFVIPGSTIKGIIRHHASESMNYLEENELFGSLKPQKGKISFFDAYADSKTVRTTIRYNTAINKVSQSAKTTTLNDMQIVEKGIFKAGFKIINFKPLELSMILHTLCDINLSMVRFGGRRSRGFGQLKVENFKIVLKNGYGQDFQPINPVEINSLNEAYQKYKCDRS